MARMTGEDGIDSDSRTKTWTKVILKMPMKPEDADRDRMSSGGLGGGTAVTAKTQTERRWWRPSPRYRR
jgi:hypothetical protein